MHGDAVGAGIVPAAQHACEQLGRWHGAVARMNDQRQHREFVGRQRQPAPVMMRGSVEQIEAQPACRQHQRACRFTLPQHILPHTILRARSLAIDRLGTRRS